MDEGQSANGEGSSKEQEASNWPRSEQVADGVPGADEHLRLVSSQHHSFILRNFHISIYLHHVCMVIYRDKDTYKTIRHTIGEIFFNTTENLSGLE